MPVNIRQSGNKRDILNVYVREGSNLRTIQKVYARVSGTLHTVYTRPLFHTTINLASGQTTVANQVSFTDASGQSLTMTLTKLAAEGVQLQLIAPSGSPPPANSDTVFSAIRFAYTDGTQTILDRDNATTLTVSALRRRDWTWPDNSVTAPATGVNIFVE